MKAMVRKLSGTINIVALCGSEGATNDGIRAFFDLTFYFDEIYLNRAKALQFFSDENYRLELINFEALSMLNEHSIVVFEDCERLSTNTIQKIASILHQKIPIIIMNASWSWAEGVKNVFQRSRNFMTLDLELIHHRGLYAIELKNRKNEQSLIKNLYRKFFRV